MSFYKFVNVTKNTSDTIEKTNILDIGIISLFESIIAANGWNSRDIIMAFPEKKENAIIRYKDGDFEFKLECDEEQEEEQEEEEEQYNCTICGDILYDNTYGNICKMHVPSYSLWEDNLSTEEFYEEISERKLAIELDDLDYGQCYDDNGIFYDDADIDKLYQYKSEDEDQGEYDYYEDEGMDCCY